MAVEMDPVFRALADPTRRRLLDRLGERNGQTLGELCAGLDIARQSVSKHLAVLEARPWSSPSGGAGRSSTSSTPPRSTPSQTGG